MHTLKLSMRELARKRSARGCSHKTTDEIFYELAVAAGIVVHRIVVTRTADGFEALVIPKRTATPMADEVRAVIANRPSPTVAEVRHYISVDGEPFASAPPRFGELRPVGSFEPVEVVPALADEVDKAIVLKRRDGKPAGEPIDFAAVDEASEKVAKKPRKPKK
jgi:hypothetical protein